MTRVRLICVDFFERPVRLRLPFRFGAATLREAPQTFVRARIRLDDGREGDGVSAELLAPKWFDKSPALSNEQNFDQLRASLAMARRALLAAGESTAFALSAAVDAAHHAACAAAGLNGLVASYGLALIDRALIDALGRLERASVFALARENLLGLDASTAPDLDGFDFQRFLAELQPASSIQARHTVGLIDPLTASDLDPAQRVNDGLPETLEEVVATYGNRYFKLKISGQIEDDVDRLSAIATVLDRFGDYRATLDGNEQYQDIDGVVELWRRIGEDKRLARLKQSILFIEQPIARDRALSAPVRALSDEVPIEIDESDADIAVFPQARALGYRGISSKTCKGLYKSMLNRIRCELWNAEAGGARYFMSAEDLTTQPGVAVQQDLALATLVGATHIERNGHHYGDGMSGAPAHEQDGFLSAHPGLYQRAPHGRLYLTIRDGTIALGSLDTPGLGVGPMPDFDTMTPSSKD
jgi:L-alanine-DL-glutamate epimerase-like enolase superfamily enzyme